MSNTPSELKYASSHEWARLDGDVVTVGITDHAQEALGDLVYVELPEVGDTVSAGDEAGVVESVKAASDIYAPVSGEVIAVNDALGDTPEIINTDPYNEGWIYKIRISDVSELDNMMSGDEYDAQVAAEH
ncbi:MAG: glycine cleavage system protein GcvH [Fluviicoccus sp.]|uniref:glycine cleavage system protein GcvH n=1 Tax=Fluviicoccus sp. TaxID=2003552 RepID=UPI00271F79AF|nr:glycine cleavage system protein GcvH [Fluviicoccus sp.]MDO8330329.1 glycine cleavage system protein GcvH [Fluviicoccus sp.]